jgi:squamous cell carcinoma antigen recognized by T-cells 3
LDTRKDLLIAVDATRYHIVHSHEIWNAYMAFELGLLDLDPSKDNIEHVRSLYLDRLQTIHMAWDQTFEGFSTFISAHDNANYEETMVTVNQKCARTKEAIGERELMESELVGIFFMI